MKNINDGWYFTGDVGCYDPNGKIFILGRVSDLIKYKTDYVLLTIQQYIVYANNLLIK